MVVYDSAAIFVDSAADNCAKIACIDLILEALLTTAMKSAGTDNIEEYSLNDGQTIIRTEYKGTDGVMKSYKSWQQIRQIYVNRLNGRMVRLVDSGSINTGRNGGR